MLFNLYENHDYFFVPLKVIISFFYCVSLACGFLLKLLISSGNSTGGAVPAVAQLASSYHAVVTSRRLPSPSSQDDKMHKTGTAL